VEYNKLIGILDMTRTLDSVCVKYIDNNNSTRERKSGFVTKLKKLIGQVAPKNSELLLKKEVDAPDNYDVLLREWVEDRKYESLKNSKDMKDLRDFLLTFHAFEQQKLDR